MPDIYDPKRGLKIGLTDADYDDYQNGNLSNDFYARRTDGSIANRVDIRPWDNDDNDDNDDYEEDDDNEIEVPSGEIDLGSAVIGGFIVIFIIELVRKIKKLLGRHKKKKTEAQVKIQKEDSLQTAIKTVNTTPSTETVNDYAERTMLTQEEAIQELMKIIVGMAEIADGKKKVSEGVENLSNAGLVDRAALLEKLSDPKVLEDFNDYLEKNPHIVIQNRTILSGIFGRDLTTEGMYVPLTISDIERQLNTETIQED